jgi:uncharacterized membrane protein
VLVSVKKKTWVNRGFLNGPMIPLYGAGATIVYILLGVRTENAVLVFLEGMILASILEYITSLLMERIFHAKWWDYSQNRYNLHGRICVMASLFWGFLSILMTEVLQPLMNQLIANIPRLQGEFAGYFILLVFFTDLTVTVIYTLQLDKKVADMQRLREEFTEYVINSKLHEATEELRTRLENTQITEWMDGFHGKKYFDEIEARFKSFITKYQKGSEKKSFVQIRLLKAFPSISFINREYALRDLKDKLFEKRKNKK